MAALAKILKSPGSLRKVGESKAGASVQGLRTLTPHPYQYPRLGISSKRGCGRQ